MPSPLFRALGSPPREADGRILHSLSNQRFDRIYPESIRNLSRLHWSPVSVCRRAATLLDTKPGNRVLDIGCGPGKFCVIGALTTSCHYTGVEHREWLARSAREMVERYRVLKVEIIHGNITEMDFRAFDAFYLFNSFEENILPGLGIDDWVPLEPGLYNDYAAHVRSQLSRMPAATRVVTYCGDGGEIPASYRCVTTAFRGQMRLWVKQPTSFLRAAALAHALDEERIPAGTGELVYA